MEDMLGTERAEYLYFLDRYNYTQFASMAPPSQTTMHYAVQSPEHGFNSTGYTKGALFMRMLEDRIGRPQLDAFLREYFTRYAFRWVDDRNFVWLLRARVDDATEAELQLDTWIYGPGLPANVTAPVRSALYDRVSARAKAFSAGTSMQFLVQSPWPDVEIDLFLQLLSVNQIRPRLAEIDAALGLSFRNTPPLLWLRHAAGGNYSPSSAAIERFLMRGGPNGAIILLYQALVTTPAGRVQAAEIFARARDRYAPYVVGEVERLLAASSASVLGADSVLAGAQIFAFPASRGSSETPLQRDRCGTDHDAPVLRPSAVFSPRTSGGEGRSGALQYVPIESGSELRTARPR